MFYGGRKPQENYQLCCTKGANLMDTLPFFHPTPRTVEVLMNSVFPSGQSGPWSGPWVGSPASPAVVLKSLGQSGLNY